MKFCVPIFNREKRYDYFFFKDHFIIGGLFLRSTAKRSSGSLERSEVERGWEEEGEEEKEERTRWLPKRSSSLSLSLFRVFFASPERF